MVTPSNVGTPQVSRAAAGQRSTRAQAQVPASTTAAVTLNHSATQANGAKASAPRAAAVKWIVRGVRLRWETTKR